MTRKVLLTAFWCRNQIVAWPRSFSHDRTIRSCRLNKGSTYMDGEIQLGLTPGSFARRGTVPGYVAISKTSAKANAAERAMVVCILVFSTGAFVNLFPGEKGVEGIEQGLLFAQVLWSLLYIVMLWTTRDQMAEICRLLWREKLLSLLLGWAFLSLIWSTDRQVTIRHLVALAGSCVFGVYFGLRYQIREQLRYLLIALAIVTTASAIACIMFPAYGITLVGDLIEPPGWRGVFSTKNNLGTIALLEALILALYFAKRVRRATTLVALSLVFALIVMTESMTALLYFVIGMIALSVATAWHKIRAKRMKIFYSALCVISGFAIWIYNYWENFLAYLGKDPRLTGRFMLWDLALTWIREKPLLGYGYDAFWSDYYGPAADFRMASGWLEAPHAHNGFINLWLDLGIIGVLLFIIGFVIFYRRAVSLAKVAGTVEGLWPVILLTFLFVYSLTEIGFMRRNDLYWILYVSVIAGLRHNFNRTAEKGFTHETVKTG